MSTKKSINNIYLRNSHLTCFSPNFYKKNKCSFQREIVGSKGLKLIPGFPGNVLMICIRSLWSCLLCIARDRQLRGVWKYQRGVIRMHKSKKDRQHNGQKKKNKKTKYYTEDWTIWTSLKNEGDRRCSARVRSFSINDTRHVTLLLTRL